MGVRTITHSYVVKSSVVNESKLTILACGLLPVYGYSPHPQDLYAICSKIDLKQRTEGSQFWTAYAEWKTFAGPRDPRDQQKNPDQRRPDLEVQLPADQQILSRRPGRQAVSGQGDDAFRPAAGAADLGRRGHGHCATKRR